MKLRIYAINSGVNLNNASREVVSGRGISMTIKVMIIAIIASIKASNLSLSTSITYPLIFLNVRYYIPHNNTDQTHD